MATLLARRRIRPNRPDSPNASRRPHGSIEALSFARRQSARVVDRTTAMTPEIYTIIAVAIALAGLILNGQRSIAKSIAELRGELNALREQVNHDIAALSERVARLEGLLEGLRDAITAKAA